MYKGRKMNLAERLGISENIAPVLTQAEFEMRLEQVVSEALSDSLGHRNNIVVTRKNSGKRIEKFLKGTENYTYPSSVEMFRAYYGIGKGLQSQVTLKDIGKIYDMGGEAVRQRINFVSNVLRQKYSETILSGIFR